MKKKTTFFLILIIVSGLCFAVSVDIKTKFAEKSELTAIKVGAAFWLEKKGIDVANIGEDYAVWLKNLRRKFVKENQYAYNLTVTLSYPTSMVEKETIKEETIHFEIFLDAPIKEQDEELDKRLKRRFTKLKDRLKKEAYIGGLMTAAAILKLLKSENAL